VWSTALIARVTECIAAVQLGDGGGAARSALTQLSRDLVLAQRDAAESTARCESANAELSHLRVELHAAHARVHVVHELAAPTAAAIKLDARTAPKLAFVPQALGTASPVLPPAPEVEAAEASAATLASGTAGEGAAPHASAYVHDGDGDGDEAVLETAEQQRVRELGEQVAVERAAAAVSAQRAVELEGMVAILEERLISAQTEATAVELQTAFPAVLGGISRAHGHAEKTHAKARVSSFARDPSRDPELRGATPSHLRAELRAMELQHVHDVDTQARLQVFIYLFHWIV